jgi:hypothetical protein
MKVLRIVGAIFATIGAGLLIGAFIAYGSAQSFNDNALRAKGVVVDLEPTYSSNSGTTYTPVVTFETPERESVTFHSSVSSSPPSFDVGESVEVLYDPANPSDAVIDSFWQVYLVPIILGGIGGVFFVVGGGLLLAQIASRRKRARLLASGRRITATIASVDLNTSLAVNGRHPYCITSQWVNPDTGQVHVFRSEGIWFDPSSHLTAETIDVLIDPVNPRRYYVDTGFLPAAAE